MTDVSDYAGRFLNAAEDIRQSLARKYPQERFAGLGEAWRHAANKKNRIICQHQKTLEALTKLRNVMQHSPVLNGAVLATPREDAVLALESIANQVRNPPKINEYMVKNPSVIASTDPLSKATSLVINEGYSQLPVYDEGRYQHLFTTNSLARWLSDAIRRENGDIIESNVTIDDVLNFSEDHERPKFVRPTESAYSVCDLLSSETPIPAVLITTDGHSSGELQGIVTQFDVPRIIRSITINFPQH